MESIKAKIILALKTIITLCFFLFPSFSLAYNVHFVNENAEIPYVVDRFIASSTETIVFDDLFLKDGNYQYATYIQQVVIVHNANCTWGQDGIHVEARLVNYDDFYVWYCEEGIFQAATTTTQILSLHPENASTTISGDPVYFELKAYINQNNTWWNSVGIKVSYQDLNGFWRVVFQNEDVLLNTQATSSGLFFFATSTDLQDGNYKIEAILRNETFGGALINPFTVGLGVIDHVTNYFVVGTSTFMGQAATQLGSALDTLIGITPTASSTLTELLKSCRPFSGEFDTLQCLTALLVPDYETIEDIITEVREGFMTRFPWGYATRVFALLNGSATSTLPVLALDFDDIDDMPDGLSGVSFTIDPFSAFASTSPLVTAQTKAGNSFLDVFMPFWKILIWSLFVLAVFHALIKFKHKIQ